MNKQHVTLQVLLDLSAAFNAVNLNVLLHRLHSKFGISGMALEWFRSYINKRSQSLNLDFSVTWGSCLGPLLFTIYTNMPNCLMLSRYTFPRFTVTLTTRSCMCLSVQTKASDNLRLSLPFSTMWMTCVIG